jgi:hypothetical protein
MGSDASASSTSSRIALLLAETKPDVVVRTSAHHHFPVWVGRFRFRRCFRRRRGGGVVVVVVVAGWSASSSAASISSSTSFIHRHSRPTDKGRHSKAKAVGG